MPTQAEPIRLVLHPRVADPAGESLQIKPHRQIRSSVVSSISFKSVRAQDRRQSRQRVADDGRIFAADTSTVTRRAASAFAHFRT